MSSTNELKTDSQKINVFNRQRKLRVDVSALNAFLVRVRERLSFDLAFSVALVSDRVMQQFNSRFAGKPYPTDVLSFPADSPEEPYLGDIVISVESADRQRLAALDTEIKILALHGILHLMGYDHECDDGEMQSLEGSLREEFGLE